MLRMFTVWSLFAVPLAAVFYCMGFLFKKSGLGRYYPLPKCAGSFLFAGGAALAYAAAGQAPIACLLFWALILCLAGDFLIEYHLIAGGLAFGAAHSLIMLYLIRTSPVIPADLVLWAVIFALFLFLFRAEMPRMGGLLVPFLLYAAVLTGGLAFAVLLPFTRGIAFLPLPLGLLSFLISDMILGKRHFGCQKRYLSEILMAFYYLALFLISAAPWFTSQPH